MKLLRTGSVALVEDCQVPSSRRIRDGVRRFGSIVCK